MTELTPAMISAGENRWKELQGEEHTPAEVVAEIFEAMDRAASAPPLLVLEQQQPDLVEVAVLAFNDIAKECPRWTACVSMTDSRRKLILQRLKQAKLKGWIAALKLAKESDFLGGAPKRGHGEFSNWRMDITWFAKAENFAKICDGKYPPPTGLERKRGLESAADGLTQFLNEHA